MIEPKNAEILPVMYPLLDHIEMDNGRHVVLIDQKSSSKGKYPTGKIYNVVTLVLLESSLESTALIKPAIENRQIGLCIVAGRCVQALYLHELLHDKLTKKRPQEDNGYVVKHNGQILGLINHGFDLEPLVELNYTDIAKEATISLQAPDYLLPIISTYFLNSAPIEGTFPFILKGSKNVKTGKLSQLDQALDYNFIVKFDVKALKTVIGEKKVSFLKFVGGECTSIACYETLFSFASSFSLFTLNLVGQIGILKYKPNIESLNAKQFDQMIKETISRSASKQGTRCLVS